MPMYETHFLQNWLPRWNQILTQSRFIQDWVITSIQWMMRWWVLVHCGLWWVGAQFCSAWDKLESMIHSKILWVLQRAIIPSPTFCWRWKINTIILNCTNLGKANWCQEATEPTSSGVCVPSRGTNEETGGAPCAKLCLLIMQKT
jgi:hypothetical protein